MDLIKPYLLFVESHVKINKVSQSKIVECLAFIILYLKGERMFIQNMGKEVASSRWEGFFVS